VAWKNRIRLMSFFLCSSFGLLFNQFGPFFNHDFIRNGSFFQS
jgi:hypothetical protein